MRNFVPFGQKKICGNAKFCLTKIDVYTIMVVS